MGEADAAEDAHVEADEGDDGDDAGDHQPCPVYVEPGSRHDIAVAMVMVVKVSFINADESNYLNLT